MDQTVSSVLSLIFLAIGLVAVFIMLNLQGNPKDRPSARRLRLLHRIFGYLFLLIFIINLVFMTQRLIGFSDEPSPRLLLHITLALLLIPVFLVKISIARFYKKLYPYLMPLGLGLFFIGFLMIAITTGYYLISTAEMDEEADMQEIQLTPEAPETIDTSKTGLRGDSILKQKCTICHNLDRVRKADKTASQWKKTIDRMIAYTRDPDHLSGQEKSLLVKHLTSPSLP